MKKSFAIWIDYSGAIIGVKHESDIMLTRVDSEIETHIREEGQTADKTKFSPSHVSNNEHRNEHRLREQVLKYFKNLAAQLGQGSEIFLFGPGEAKKEFSNYLQKSVGNMNINIKGVENSAYLTENQLIAKMKILLG